MFILSKIDWIELDRFVMRDAAIHRAMHLSKKGGGVAVVDDSTERVVALCWKGKAWWAMKCSSCHDGSLFDEPCLTCKGWSALTGDPYIP